MIHNPSSLVRTMVRIALGGAMFLLMLVCQLNVRADLQCSVEKLPHLALGQQLSNDPPPNPAVGSHIVNKIPGTSDPHPPGTIDWYRAAVPPAPTPLDFSADAPLEHAIEATHIKFDHKAGGASDALNIRWTKDYDLQHEGDGIGKGEYVPSLKRNEPTCFVAKSRCTVKVRFEAKLSQQPAQALAKATVRADANGSATWLALAERAVKFQNGVSQGDDGTEYVEFTCTEPVRKAIDADAAWFKFYAKDLKDKDDNSVDTPNVEVTVDETSRIDTYTVLENPGSPWYLQGAKSEPWLSALHFSIAYRCQTMLCASVSSALYETTTSLHGRHNLRYDRVESKSAYTGFAYRTPPPDPSNPPPPDGAVIDLESYMLRTSPTCNCHDQMAAVTVLGNLVAGNHSAGYYFDLFGYMATATLVGGAYTNNPLKDGVFQIPGGVRYTYDSRDVVGADDLMLDQDRDGDLDRSLFTNHAFVITDGLVKDACCGPYTDKNMADYFSVACDRSNQNECGFASYDAQGNVTIVKNFNNAGSEIALEVGLR